MFKIESYVTSILLSYVDKYVRDFKPSNAQVSLWAGGVALHNLVLKADVLQQEVALPFTVFSGRIHELLIQVPWTKIVSEPIVVTIDTIECVLGNNSSASTDEGIAPQPSRGRSQLVEAPPSYMQALVRRIITNISVKVHHLIIKYVHNDIVLSLNVKHLSIDSAGTKWKPTFSDFDQEMPVIRKLVNLDDLTLCLDHSDSDGKIRFYHEPLLYRCRIELRVLARLASAKTSGATSLNVQFRSSKLAWGISTSQLILLLRMLSAPDSLIKKESSSLPRPKISTDSESTPPLTTSADFEVPEPTDSWSKWVWSWLPSWTSHQDEVEETPVPITPTPIYISAYFDEVSLILKVMEIEEGNRKRTRSILEFSSCYLAVQCHVCACTMLRIKAGARVIVLKSQGKCVCGHLNINAAVEESTTYMSELQTDKKNYHWEWPDVDNNDNMVDSNGKWKGYGPKSSTNKIVEESNEGSGSKASHTQNIKEFQVDIDAFWQKMEPLIYLEYTHERSPPSEYIISDDITQSDIQFSNGQEECELNVQLRPMQLQISAGLLHRISALRRILIEYQTNIKKNVPEIPPCTLTLEQCKALRANIPQRRINICIQDFRLLMHPWDHSTTEKPLKPPLVLNIDIPKAVISISGPLYSQKVCLAACQLKDETDPLWQGTKLHVSALFESIEAKICLTDAEPKTCARTDIRFVIHTLLNRQMFKREQTVVLSYSIKMRDARLSGSAARLWASCQIPISLLNERLSLVLRHTTLAEDALNDEDSVTLDITLKELAMRGYFTTNINTHIVTLQSAQVTASHLSDDEVPKNTWIFSAPDVPSTTPYLRAAIQWGFETSSASLDYIGVWTEPLAFCIDPLFIAWLAYKPRVKQIIDDHPLEPFSRTISSTQYFMRRRYIQSNLPDDVHAEFPMCLFMSGSISTSSGHGVGLSNPEVEVFNVMSPCEKTEPSPNQQMFQSINMLKGNGLLKLYSERLQHMLITVELGLMLAYVTMSTASASDCSTIRLAMEQHVVSSQRVLVISAGRWSMYSSALTKQLWQDIRHDGPTFITDLNRTAIESFPWKIRFADVSCYTMDTHGGLHSSSLGRERAPGLRSQLRTQHIIQSRTILELVTTTLTLSIVKKSMHYRTFLRKPDCKKQSEPDKKEDKMKYFVSGSNFKPTTLKEFVRGPERRGKTPLDTPKTDESGKTYVMEPDQKITTGPVVSIGITLHADTPPIIVTADHEQVHMLVATIHCLAHVMTLFQRGPMVISRKQDQFSAQSLNKCNARPLGEIDEQVSEGRENACHSEFIPIFQAHPGQEREPNITIFLRFQWVIGRTTVIIRMDQVKLVLDVENIVSSVDVQEHYNQLKVKVSSASVRYFKRTDSNEWTAGVSGGRVLGTREPNTARDNMHFLTVIITQAQISNLPTSWKEELHPKFFEQTDNVNSMWEIYATLAPIEVVLQPTILENIVSIASEMAPRSFCLLRTEVEMQQRTRLWPFCYFTAGGFRLIVGCEHRDKPLETDDTFTISCDGIMVNPHPENPICRRLVKTCAEIANQAVGFEGRQYELLVNNIAISSAQFAQLVYEEGSEPNLLKVGGEAHGHKLSRTISSDNIASVISSLDICCVFAPALFVDDVLTCGPGVELNFMSNCVIELNIDQLELIRRIYSEMSNAFRKRPYSCSHFNGKKNVCPYATPLVTQLDTDHIFYTHGELGNSEEDSEADMASNSTLKTNWCSSDIPLTSKKTTSVLFFELEVDPKEHLEIFVTMGTIELSLYAIDDNSPEIIALRPKEDTSSETKTSKPSSTKTGDNLQLLHIMLQQPNLYFMQQKTQKSFQVSLFNAWVSFDAAEPEDCWRAVLMCTAQGVVDPVTDIPPALATMKFSVSTVESITIDNKSATDVRGTLHFDIERPVLFEVCVDRLTRLRGIFELIKRKIALKSRRSPGLQRLQILDKLRRFMVKHSIETMTVQTSQVGINGYEGSVGWDSASLQVAWDARPERMVVRSLVSAALVSAGTPHDARHSILHPLQLGVELNATWESWRLAEGGVVSQGPTVNLRFDFDRITIDIRPEDLSGLKKVREALKIVLGRNIRSSSVQSNNAGSTFTPRQSFTPCMSSANIESYISDDSLNTAAIDHCYTDDLRSGAFKIVRGGQLPMANELMLSRGAVSWRYPHPRAITRLIAFPLPEQNLVIECILEVYNDILTQWEPHTYFDIPLYDLKEIQLYVPPPEAIFATLWRFRICSNVNHKTTYEFCMAKYMPRENPLISDCDLDPETAAFTADVTAEQLSGALRIDSYFSPQLLPRLRLSIQLSTLELYAHNSMPFNTSQATPLEGYYVSKPLMRSHRVLALNAHETTMYAGMGSPAGSLFLINTCLSNDILDCASGTLEPLLNEFKVQLAMSLKGGTLENPRLRCRTSKMHLALHVARLRTLHALAVDWRNSFKQFESETSLQSHIVNYDDKIKSRQELADATMASLEGRVSLWLYNSCVCALRVGQEGTEEVLPLESGTRLAYRWRNPNAIRKLRFAFANPSADWRWSSSIPFSVKSYCVRLEAIDRRDIAGSSVFLHVDVKQKGSIRCMHISGRLLLANMLRFGLLYKVRLRFSESKTWRTVSSGELATECIGRSTVCSTNCEMVLKIKSKNHKHGWSGYIPLKECPKENVPWLVKVPSEGDVPYISVWCRVVRTRYDGRIIASIWPLYVLHSHLPLDTDVLIVTNTNPSSRDPSSTDLPTDEVGPPPLMQTALGRGTSTHLLAPGTTITKHSLSFQYRDIECPVTRKEIPLHYGVTDTSVFDKSASVSNIDEVLQDIIVWLNRSRYGTETTWPYSLVTRHWSGNWQPALSQPRCDVTIRYQAVRAGGGCSLEIHLSPVVLLCNASPVALTLRAHDSTPLCKLEMGTAISPSTAMLTDPFFMSVEVGRETFVSGRLEVCTGNPKRALSTGQVALGYPTTFAIECNQKMALFTMYYEIKDEINIFGITATYSLNNMLDTDILVSAIAVTGDNKKDVQLHPKTFKVLQPTTKGNFQGIPLCRFRLRERWRGGDASRLHTFLCLALPTAAAGSPACPASSPVPVHLGQPPARRALALVDVNKKSIAVVVTQQKHEGRWYITVAPDPCPQFMVHNRTCYSLAIAQPSIQPSHEASSSYTTAVPDCLGARCWSVVEPDSVMHYSSPAHCTRSSSTPEATQFLTFSRIKDESEPDWCPPVAARDGEQSVRLCRGLTIKMRVCIHPHCSLVELQNVEQKTLVKTIYNRHLERVCAEDKLLDQFQCSIVQTTKESQRNSSTRQFCSETSLVSVGSLVSNKDGDVADKETTSKPLETFSNKVDETQAIISMSKDSNTISAQDQFQNPYVQLAEELHGNLSTLQIYSATSLTTQNTMGIKVSKHDGCVTTKETDVKELIRCIVDSVAVVISVTDDSRPLFALYLDRFALSMSSDGTKTKTTLTVANIQVDNPQYESEQFDFAVVVAARAEPFEPDRWPALWNMFAQKDFFSTHQIQARLVLNMLHEMWAVVACNFNELTEVDIRIGPLALYVEESYVTALVELFRLIFPCGVKTHSQINLSAAQSLQRPLCLRNLHIHPLDVTFTLHASRHIYIALDKSLIHLSPFTLQNMMTSAEHLTHELTVHYLSAAILGAGWIVGGLELLGAPGAFAARMVDATATGGIRDIASATAVSIIRSLSTFAESLAYNLDMLAGEDELAHRARRRSPDTFIAGVATGLTNIAMNVLGIVGGLPYHPIIREGICESNAAALKRGLLVALTKPLSATADLVAFAGHGLLKQTGWDPTPQPRQVSTNAEYALASWRRNCVRWTFRLAEMTILAGFEVLLNNAHLQLLLTHKFIVVADPESERIVEMIDLRFCTMSPYQGTIIELYVSQRRISKIADSQDDEDDEYQVSSAAMTRRTSRGTGAEDAAGISGSRILLLLPAPGQSYALRAALAAGIHYNSDTHFALL